MADNLKQLTTNVDTVIPINGGIASVKTVNHNPFEKEIIAKVGKHTGFPYLAGRTNVDDDIPTGTMFWLGTPMNETDNFDIILSKTTLDGNNIERVLELIGEGAIIHFKDFVGRSVTLEFVEYTMDETTSGQGYAIITVKGFPENSDYAYQVEEFETCTFEFVTSGTGLISAETIKELYESNDDTNAFTDDEKDKLEGIEENAQVNVIEKIFVNGIEQVPNVDKEVNLNIAQNERIIQSQLVQVTNTVGTTYSIVAVATAPNPIIWQNPAGEIKTRTTNFSQSVDIDITTHNVIHCLWLGYNGSIGLQEGVQVPIGTFPSYPAPPENTMSYSFVVFNAGNFGIQQTLTPQQVQDIINDAKPKVEEINANATLSNFHENKILVVTNNVILTIPSGLLDAFLQCFVYVKSGSLTIAIEGGVTVTGYYSLTLNQFERGTLFKESPITNAYIFG